MIKHVSSILEIDSRVQERCFLPSTLGSYNFYKAIEESQSLIAANGWSARYAVSENGFMPLFWRTSSGDDFSYDTDTSKIYEEKTGKPYYPKLQICIPFMPIEGTKFHTTGDKKKFIGGVLEWAKKQNVSSLNISLADPNEYTMLESLGFVPSEQRLCYWTNHNFKSFSDFTATMKSKFRSQIQQERNTVAQTGYSHEFVTGDQIKASHIDKFFELFELTHNRKGWIMSKLTRDFFHRFAKTSANQIVLIFIRKGDEVVAASCHFVQDNLLCGRFWGSVHDDHFLHFEVMYYLPIEYCIQNNIPKMEIGFEKPHKVIRGFVPQIVKSFHYIFDENFMKDLPSLFPPKTLETKNIFR